MTEEQRGAKGFVPPTSFDDAHNRLSELKIAIADIQAQLASRTRSTPDGGLLAVEEFETWQRRATGAISHRQRELLQVKEWIRRENVLRKRHEVGTSKESKELLDAAFVAMKALCNHVQRQDQRIAELEAIAGIEPAKAA